MMQILNLKREFEMVEMKTSEGVREYGGRLMSIVNQIKLLGGEFDNQRVVDKLIVTLPRKYEAKLCFPLLRLCIKGFFTSWPYNGLEAGLHSSIFIVVCRR